MWLLLIRGSLPMTNNLMQIHSAGEFSDDCYMQIQAGLFQQRLKQLELPIRFSIIKKTFSFSQMQCSFLLRL